MSYRMRWLSRLDLWGLLLSVLALLAPLPALHLVAALLLICVWPGIACARWLGQAFDWRDARSWATVLIGSMALSPLIVFFAVLFVPFSLTSSSLAIGAVSAIGIITAPRAPPTQPPVYFSRAAWLLIGLTLLIVAVALMPIRNEYRASILPMSGAYRADDWFKHYGLTWEIEASGMPPKNLFFLYSPPRVHPYYLFYHLSAALLDLLSGQSLGINFWLVSYTTLVAATFLMSFYVLARRLWANETAALASLFCVSLLGGLDAIPSFANFVLQRQDYVTPYVHVDSWDGCIAEVSTFVTAFLWVPQHILSLAMTLLAWLIFTSRPIGYRAKLLIVLLLISAFGHSLYVPMGVLIAIGLLVVFNSVHAVRARALSDALRNAWPWVVVGVIAVMLVLPLAAYELSGRPAGAEFPFGLWVRTLNIADPSVGTIFQWLFPQGGLIAQALDLPLHFVLEFGAILLLALIGLAVWYRKWLEYPQLIGTLAGAASLALGLFVRSNLGCNDLGMRVVFPFQTVLALAAGGGWLALRDQRSSPAKASTPERVGRHNLSLPMTRTSNFLLAVGAMMLSVILIVLAYQWPWTYRYELTQSNNLWQPITGLYAIESANGIFYRWTQKRVTVPFDGVAQNVTYQLVIQAAAGSRPLAAPKALASVWLNGSEVGQFMASEAQQTFSFDLTPAVLGGQASAQLELQIGPYRPNQFGLGDRRELGLLLESVTLKPLAASAPIVLPPLDVIVAAMLLSFFAIGLSQHKIWLATGQLVIMLALLTMRPLATAALPYVALLLGMAWLGWRVAPRVANGIITLMADGHARWLLIGIAPFALMGLTTTAWQVVSLDIGKLMPPYNAQAAALDAQSLAFDDALRFIRTQTPKESVFLMDPNRPRPDAGLRASVTVERPTLFTDDQVFVYQVAPNRLTQRRMRVEQAFAAPNLDVACNHFRELGVNLILVEPARGYAWLADPDAPGTCFKTLYQNSLVSVLEMIE